MTIHQFCPHAFLFFHSDSPRSSGLQCRAWWHATLARCGHVAGEVSGHVSTGMGANWMSGDTIFPTECGANVQAEATLFTKESCLGQVPSGKLLYNGKSSCFMGKLTISMVIFNSYVKIPEGNIFATYIQFGSSLVGVSCQLQISVISCGSADPISPKVPKPLGMSQLPLEILGLFRTWTTTWTSRRAGPDSRSIWPVSSWTCPGPIRVRCCWLH